MLFNSVAFIGVFLPITLAGFFGIARFDRLWAAGWLTLASLVFYAWWSVAALPLLLASAAANYGFGLLVSPRRGLGPRARHWWLVAALAANLGLLGLCKYAGFATANANALLVAAGWPGLADPGIALPIGISFYTFTQIAFVVDCARGRVEERHPVHYLLFVSFFPHLIAGPILHHGQIMPQFRQPAPYRPDLDGIAAGLTIFWIGLAKKLVIADGLADFVASGFDFAASQPVGFVDGWAMALSYTVQLYFDFSGYADMAIGLALLFGIRFPVNFASPYRAGSIIEFWRRWHITLSAFLRDYLYIPLGGGRRGAVRRAVNIMVTMTLGGLWHGASWTFVLWGAAHGVMLLVNHGWRALRGHRDTTLHGRIAGRLLTFGGVVAAWVLFRADSIAAALNIWRGMTGLQGVALPAAVAALLPVRPDFVTAVAAMPGLGGGGVMGVFEQAALVLLGLGIALFGRPTLAMPPAWRLAVVVLTAGFVARALFFAEPRPFLYFQF